ncbi:hypothetical protein MKZ38_010003 [Zalerion maritima]|uniref:C2H2-type domain-containing protein n=1 Tax=Zalerion maritima TaxID=339359 RepID=A0AAD5WM62_9PEZI|nr:hypothetical protein MKZ38_010003 [Zalerion maritima]
MAPRGLPTSVLSLVGRHAPAHDEDISIHSGIVRRSTSISSGAKAGIAVGCIVGVAILCCFAWPFIARLRRGSKPTPYHPSQDDPAHNIPAVSETSPGDRRLSIKTLEDQQPVSPDRAFNPQKAANGLEQSPFDPNYPVPPHYQDHPDYVAYQQAMAARAAAAAAGPEIPQPLYHGPSANPPQVSIEPSTSRLGQLKDNAKNKILWSADKAQFIKKAFKDVNREGEDTGPGKARGQYDLDDLESPGTKKQFGWFTSLFQSQDAGPSQFKTEGATLGPGADQSAHRPQQVLSPSPSGPSAPVSPASRIEDTFEQPDAPQQPSTLLSSRSGLPSPPLVDYPTFDPKHLWNPTTQTERQYSVNHELVMLETGSATASPPPQAPLESSPSEHLQPPIPEYLQHATPERLQQPTPDHLQPTPNYLESSPEPPQHLDPRTPSPQPVFTPETHDTEMQEVSDFSTPLNNMHDTPASRFTDSEFNAASPKSNIDGEPNYASPQMAFGRPLADGPDAASPAGPSSAASPADPPSAASPREHKCDECGKTFEQIHRLNHHKRYHDRKHECTVPGCNKKFGTKTHLDRHINDKHKKTRKFYCTEPTCPYSIQGGKSFPRKDNWVRHIRKKHRNLSISQADAQGFVIDEETGTTQSVAAPPSQDASHHMDMGYGMSMNVPMNMAHSMGGGMGNGMGNGMSMNYGMNHGMNGGMNNGMGMGMEMNMGMNMQQPPMPPGAGFNSSWNMGHQNGF